jgi:hypothetical protein
MCGVGYSIFDNKWYARTEENNDGEAPPEARLPLAMIGAVAIPDWHVLVCLDEWPKHPLDRQHHRFGARRLRNGARVPGLRELPHRCLHHIRGVGARGQHGPSVAIWRCLSTFHLSDVPKPRHSLGKFDPGLLGPGLFAFSIPLLRIRGSDPHEVQRFCTST